MGVRLIKYGVEKNSGTLNHNELMNRDLVDQHPIEAITGLQEALNGLQEGLDNVAVGTESTETVELIYNPDTKLISANVILSPDPKNALITQADGLFVKESASSLIEVYDQLHTFSNLQVVYRPASGPDYKVGSSLNETTSEVVGIVKVTGTHTYEIVTSGFYETTAFSTLALGSALFLSTTGTLVTDITPDMLILKRVATVVPNGIMINILSGFMAKDFEITPIQSLPRSDYQVAINQTYDYLTEVEFNLDVPYNKFILRGLAIRMGRSSDTGSVPNKDAYHFSIKNSIREADGTDNFIPETAWNSGSIIGLKYENGIVTSYVSGGFDYTGDTGLGANVPGVLYEDYDGGCQVHLKIWCYGGTRYGASSNTINFIRVYIETIDE